MTQKTPKKIAFDDIPICYVLATLAHLGLTLVADESGGYKAVKTWTDR